MTLLKLRYVFFSLILFAVGTISPAHGDEMFVQTDSFQCVASGSTFNCPQTVTFKKPFGGSPAVALVISGFTTDSSGGPFNLLGIDATATAISPTGFHPVVGSAGPFSKSCRITYIAVGPVLLSGTLTAKYLVLAVVYAPPGTNGGHSTSSVNYQAGSTAETVLSSSQTFKTDNIISSEGSGGFLGNSGATGWSFEYSRSTTNSQSLDLKRSTTASITYNGPAQDGVNHDEDLIYLLLKPNINVGLSASAIAWVFGDNTKSIVQYVHPKWLSDPSSMPGGVLSALQSAGITPNDYPDILSHDPFTNGSATLDPSRFVSLNTTFPYEPPLNASDPVPTITLNVSDSSTSGVGSEIDETYKVGLSQSFSGSYLEYFKATMKDTLTWEWTNKSVSSSSAGTSESASLIVGGPAYGYSGPTVMQVYLDTLYKTFAFVVVQPSDHEVSVDGTLVDSSGHPLQLTEVVLVENGIRHRTITNAKGEYWFFGHITGPAIIKSGNFTQQVPTAAAATRHVPIRMP
jgi:hypothetical protein